MDAKSLDVGQARAVLSGARPFDEATLGEEDRDHEDELAIDLRKDVDQAAAV